MNMSSNSSSPSLTPPLSNCRACMVNMVSKNPAVRPGPLGDAAKSALRLSIIPESFYVQRVPRGTSVRGYTPLRAGKVLAESNSTMFACIINRCYQANEEEGVGIRLLDGFTKRGPVQRDKSRPSSGIVATYICQIRLSPNDATTILRRNVEGKDTPLP